MARKKIPSKAKPAAIIGGALAVVMTGLWLFAYQPTLAKNSEATDVVGQAQSQNDILRLSIAKLKRVEGDRAELERQIQAFVQAFPDSADQPGTMKAIGAAAVTAGVSITARNDSVPNEVTGAPTLTVAPTTRAAAGVVPSNLPPGVLATAAPGEVAGTTAAPQTPSGAVAAAPGSKPAGEPAADPDFPLAQINVTLQMEGPMSGIQKFTSVIEKGSRPVLIDQVTIAPRDGGKQQADPIVTATLDLRVFTVRYISPLNSGSPSTGAAASGAPAPGTGSSAVATTSSK